MSCSCCNTPGISRPCIPGRIFYSELNNDSDDDNDFRAKYCGHEENGRICLMKQWHIDSDINMPHFMISGPAGKGNRQKVKKASE